MSDIECPKRRGGHTPLRALQCSCGLMATDELVPSLDLRRSPDHEHHFVREVWACSTCGRQIGDRGGLGYELAQSATAREGKAMRYLLRILPQYKVGGVLPLRTEVASDVDVEFGDVTAAFTALERHGLIATDGRRHRKTAEPPPVGE